MKYRKKPVVIEATQWFKYGDHFAVYWYEADGRDHRINLRGSRMKTVIEMAREAGIRSPDLYKLTVGHMSIAQLERLVELVRADEREVWAKDADWCIQNHLEHLIPERIRARGTK